MPHYLRRILRRLKSIYVHTRSQILQPSSSAAGHDYRQIAEPIPYTIGVEPSAKASKANAGLCGLSAIPLQDLHRDDFKCSICFESYHAGDQKEIAIQISSCGHVFGSECLSRWIQTPGGARVCPLCRGPLFHPIQHAKPVMADAHEAVGHLNAFSDLVGRLQRGHVNRAHTPRGMLGEAAVHGHAHWTVESEEGTASPSSSAPPTVSEILMAYLEMVTYGVPPLQEDVLELGAEIGRAEDRLASALRTMGLRAWSGAGPSPEVLLDPFWRPVIELSFDYLLEAERIMDWYG